MKEVKVNLGKVSITVHGTWEDIDYDKLTLVYHKEKNATYISKRPIPKGTMISDKKYWSLVVKGVIPDTTIKQMYTKDEVDHIIAFSKGGTNALSNLPPLCMPCTRSKSNNYSTWSCKD